MKAHVSRTVSSCFNVLRQIRSIHWYGTRPVLQSLVVSLVLSRLDYSNAALAGLPTREWADFSQSRMLVCGSFFQQTSTIMFHRYYMTFAGCGRCSESTTRLSSRVSVSARTCSGVPVCWSIEHQGPAVETATMAMVVGHVSRPDVEPVHCWQPRFPDCRCTSLEHSVAGFSFIQFFINFQVSAQDWAFLTKLPWLKCVNFCYICKVASQLWLMPP